MTRFLSISSLGQIHVQVPRIETLSCVPLFSWPQMPLTILEDSSIWDVCFMFYTLACIRCTFQGQEKTSVCINICVPITGFQLGHHAKVWTVTK